MPREAGIGPGGTANVFSCPPLEALCYGESLLGMLALIEIGWCSTELVRGEVVLRSVTENLR